MGDPSELRFVPASVANVPIDWTRVPEASKVQLYDWLYDRDNGVTKPIPATIGELAKVFHKSKFFGYFRPSLCTLIMDISEFGLQAEPMQAGPRFYMKYLEQLWFLLFTPGRRDCVLGCSEDIDIEDEVDEEYEEYEGDEEDEEDEEEKGENEDDEKDEESQDEESQDEDEEDEDKEGGVAQLTMMLMLEPKEEDDEDEDDEAEAETEDEEYEPGPDTVSFREETAIAQKFDIGLEQDVLDGRASLVKATKHLGGWKASMLQDNLV